MGYRVGMLKLSSGTTYFTDDNGKKVCTGSQNGRPDIIPASVRQNLGYVLRLHLNRLQWVDGCYDQGGAYWGNNGSDVYCAWGKFGPNDLFVQVFVRAKSRQEARHNVKEKLSNAIFFHCPLDNR